MKILISLPRSTNYAGDQGFIMVLALMVLLVMSLLGVTSLRLSNSEVITSGSLEGSVASFYLLEGIGQLGIAQLVRQNVAGNDCIEAVPEECRVKQLYQPDTSTLPWLDEIWSEKDRDVYDLRVLDTAASEDDSIFPKILSFPYNWTTEGQRVVRVPDAFRGGGPVSLEPSGYVDVDDGGTDLIRFAVRDQGRRGVYSIGSNNPVIRDYRIFGLYHFGSGGVGGYSGTFGIELGYRLQLAKMEIL